jgi:uncharacterized membrane protein YedE/YeeE
VKPQFDVSPTETATFRLVVPAARVADRRVAQPLLSLRAHMQITHLQPLPALVGGALIGAAASVFLVFTGRIAGISGIVGGTLLRETKDRAERMLFVAGLLISGFVAFLVKPASFPSANAVPIGTAVIAGLLVGFGTRLGNGCTSGHGVCGLSRLSIRSFVATITFMAAAAITVFVTKHLLSGAP